MEHVDSPVLLRRAEVAELPALSDLALRSKAHWGYDAAFIAACKDDLTITPADLAQQSYVVAERAGAPLGFYGLRVDDHVAQLTNLFVEPAAIGQGIGRRLWQHAVALARELGAPAVLIDSDPFAEPFYLRMGARRVGEVPSTVIPGRMLPLLRYDLPE